MQMRKLSEKRNSLGEVWIHMGFIINTSKRNGTSDFTELEITAKNTDSEV